MGRLMTSLILEERNNANSTNQNNRRSETGNGSTEMGAENDSRVPKWSASNAFDPDSEDFWTEENVVHEAFVDGEDSDLPLIRDDSRDPGDIAGRRAQELYRRRVRRSRARMLADPVVYSAPTDDEDEEERREEEEALIASGNESQRRRRREINIAVGTRVPTLPIPPRTDPWMSMENLITREPQDSNPTPNTQTRREDNGGSRVRIVGDDGSTIIYDRYLPVRASYQRHEESTARNEVEENPPHDPSLTTIGMRTLHPGRISRSRQSTLDSSRIFYPPSSFSQNLSPNSQVTIQMVADAQRTTSPGPMSYVTYGDTIYVPPTARRARRRESQPPPPSISLMG